jgi:hypothetical protein
VRSTLLQPHIVQKASAPDHRNGLNLGASRPVVHRNISGRVPCPEGNVRPQTAPYGRPNKARARADLSPRGARTLPIGTPPGYSLGSQGRPGTSSMATAFRYLQDPKLPPKARREGPPSWRSEGSISNGWTTCCSSNRCPCRSSSPVVRASTPSCVANLAAFRCTNALARRE